MTIPKKLSALTVILTMILSLVGLSTPAHADTTTEITSGNLTWGYKHSWRAHMETPIGSVPGITTATGGITVGSAGERIAPTYGYNWTTISQGTSDANGIIVEFPGQLKFQKYQFPPNTEFLVDTTIQNLTLVINPDGTRGSLQADVTYRESEGIGSTTIGPFISKEITLAEVNFAAPIDFTAQTITVTNAPTTLTAEGGQIVGAPHYAGQAGDPLTFTLNLQHTTTPNQPALNPTLKTNKNMYEAGQEITLTFENGQPDTDVEFYLGETKIGQAHTNNEGKAVFTTTIDKNTAEGNLNAKVTLKDSTDTLAEKTIKITKPVKPSKPITPPTVKPTPKPIAPAKPAEEKKTEEPRCIADPKVRGVNNGGLNWSFKRSFYSYILSNVGNHGAGKITPGAGAYANNGMFYYPASHPGSMVNIENKTGRINFAGYFNFYKHNGVLNLTLSSPTLVVTSPTTGYLEVSVSSTDMSGKPVIPGRVRFANVTFANTNFSQNNFSANTSSVTLTAQGATAFAGFYKEGTPLDNFSVNVTLGEKITCYDENGNPILASTGTDTTSLTVFVILGLIGTAAIAISRKTVK